MGGGGGGWNIISQEQYRGLQRMYSQLLSRAVPSPTTGNCSHICLLSHLQRFSRGPTRISSAECVPRSSNSTPRQKSLISFTILLTQTLVKEGTLYMTVFSTLTPSQESSKLLSFRFFRLIRNYSGFKGLLRLLRYRGVPFYKAWCLFEAKKANQGAVQL